MKVTRSVHDLETLSADVLVVGHYADSGLTPAAAAVDRASSGVIQRLRASGEAAGKPLEVTLLHELPGVNVRLVALFGLGESTKLDAGTVFRSAAAAAKQIAAKARERVAFFSDPQWTGALTESALAGAIVGCQGQDLYRSQKNRFPFGELLFTTADPVAFAIGRILGESTNLTRRLVNEPPSEIYPDSFAQVAASTAKNAQLECEIWDESRLNAERCGALLAVARGSARPPRLVILEHRGGGPQAPTLALVGKGVTFDSGGLSIKPTDGMKTMKCDMAGAATVLGAMRAIGLLNLPINVQGYCGLVENMISGDAYKLGDVLRARNGKTIEVLNTDAEGRLVLADVLDVAVERGASRIIDLATLTGACVVALGNDVAGAMTNDEPWCQLILGAARACGEPIWQLPMFKEYGEQIKSEVADIKNVGDGRWGGAITAAKFLEEFVGGRPWTHLDIAGPAFLESPKPWLDAGATGAFVRTLVDVAKRFGE
ncbi:MAG: leucyl aminopeptidase [Planctomycetes bacterium]|nr:leucyl aminopeptidase [Planctomycetota bacterium]